MNKLIVNKLFKATLSAVGVFELSQLPKGGPTHTATSTI